MYSPLWSTQDCEPRPAAFGLNNKFSQRIPRATLVFFFSLGLSLPQARVRQGMVVIQYGVTESLMTVPLRTRPRRLFRHLHQLFRRSLASIFAVLGRGIQYGLQPRVRRRG